MTANQTIDGVPLLPCPFCGGEPYGTQDHYVHDDLSPMPCVECRSCSAHLKAGDWNRRVKPAAQPQGEPVAWRGCNTDGEVVTEWIDGAPPERMTDLCGNAARFDKIERAYAEQPAPVAVVMPERPRANEEEYERMTDYEKGLLHGGIELWDKISNAINTK